MAVAKINRTTVDRLPEGGTIWDTELKGFGVRRQRRAAVYVVKLRIDGRQRFWTIGEHGAPWTPETARAQARIIQGEAAKGTDIVGARSERRASITVRELAREFQTRHVARKRSAATGTAYAAILDKHVLPRLGDRRVTDVKRADVLRLHEAMADSPIAANRTLAVLGSMFGWGRTAGLVPAGPSPATGVERYPEEGRERFLSAEELSRLGDAIREAETKGVPWAPQDVTKPKAKHAPKRDEVRRFVIGAHAAAALRLLILTGARLREILHLEWSHVDVERGLLFLPKSKTGRKTIVLSAAAIEVLKSIPRVGRYVIAGESAGQEDEKPRHDLKRPWAAVCRNARLVGVRIHDMRHTNASVGAEAGLGLPIIGKLLGHTQAATTQRYAHIADSALRRASDLIGERLTSAMTDRPDNSEKEVESAQLSETQYKFPTL